MQGVAAADAKSRIWMLDSGGLIAEGRERKITEEKAQFAQSRSAAERAGVAGGCSLGDAVSALKPSCLIGAAGKGGVFTRDILQTMSQSMPKLSDSNSCNGSGGGGGGRRCGVRGMRESDTAAPIVLALSNPTDNSECSFQDAWDATDGRVVFAAGSPFPSINTDAGAIDCSQANNALIYPGLGAAVILSGATQIPQAFFLAAAHALADEVTSEEGRTGLVVPPVKRIRDAAAAVSARVCLEALKDGKASERGNGAVMKEAQAVRSGSGSENALRGAIEEWRF